MGNNDTKSLSEEEVESLESSTNFSGAEILDWYTKFHQDFPTGVITQQDFVQMYAKLFPNGDAKKFATLVFKSYDTDGNGKIDFREFVGTVSVSSRGSPKEKLQWAFSLYDTDKDGKVSVQEVGEMISAIYRMKGEFDKAKAEEAVVKVFKLLDKNKDGKLTLDEFVRGASKSKAIMDILQGQ